MSKTSIGLVLVALAVVAAIRAINPGGESPGTPAAGEPPISGNPSSALSGKNPKSSTPRSGEKRPGPPDSGESGSASGSGKEAATAASSGRGPDGNTVAGGSAATPGQRSSTRRVAGSEAGNSRNRHLGNPGRESPGLTPDPDGSDSTGPIAGALPPRGAPRVPEGIEFDTLRERDGVTYRSDNQERYSGRALQKLNDGTTVEGNFQEGLRHGSFSLYDEKGRLKAREYYADGSKDGVYSTYYPDGLPRFAAEIEGGRQVGATTWGPDGQVQSKWRLDEEGRRTDLLEARQPPAPDSGTQ